MAFWKNEKRVLGPLAAKENAPYRNCGGRFSRVAGWRGVFAQSGKEADSARVSKGPPPYVGGYSLVAFLMSAGAPQLRRSSKGVVPLHEQRRATILAYGINHYEESAQPLRRLRGVDGRGFPG